MPLFFVFLDAVHLSRCTAFSIFGKKILGKIKKFLQKSIDKIDDIVYNAIES